MALAGIFPGQGSQAVGMLADLSDSFPLIKHTFQEASESLDFDLWKLTQDGPEADLNQTINTQPAMLSAGIAVWR
ncbi:MAG: malonyl CoA-acyl carrier protein transacylase, partial [Methylococcaceae bacterium]